MMTAMQAPIPAEQLTIVPANEASWVDLVAIFGTADYAGQCQCQRFKVVGWIWRDSTQEQRTAMLRAQTGCGDPNAAATSGLVAYVGGSRWVGSRSSRGRRTPSCVPLACRGAVGARTRTTTASGR